MKAFVDWDLCIGCGACTSIAPEVFELDNEGISIPIVDQIKAEIIKFAEDAKDSCPVEALTIIKY